MYEGDKDGFIGVKSSKKEDNNCPPGDPTVAASPLEFPELALCNFSFHERSVSQHIVFLVSVNFVRQLLDGPSGICWSLWGLVKNWTLTTHNNTHNQSRSESSLCVKLVHEHLRSGLPHLCDPILSMEWYWYLTRATKSFVNGYS